jgi:elongation factor P--beta-lysine ligase
MRAPPLPYARRVAVWDAALAVVRAHLREQGLREVSTPVRVVAPAIEPYIDPIAAPPGFLATSPELAMKRLLARGSGPIFQVSHVFRQAERGDRHREEFHLLEWYRLGGELRALEADVEALVAAVFTAVGSEPPARWLRADFFALFEHQLRRRPARRRGRRRAARDPRSGAARPGLARARSTGPARQPRSRGPPPRRVDRPV